MNSNKNYEYVILQKYIAFVNFYAFYAFMHHDYMMNFVIFSFFKERKYFGCI